MVNVELEDSMIKLSVDYLTKHQKSIHDAHRTNRVSNLGVCELYSHFEMLHHYNKEQYSDVIELYDQIERQLAAITSSKSLIINEFCVSEISLLHPFRILFSHELSALMGLIQLIDVKFFQSSFDGIRQSSTSLRELTDNISAYIKRIIPVNNKIENVVAEDFQFKVQPCVLLIYLKLQSLIRTSSSPSEILRALQHTQIHAEKSKHLGRVFEMALILIVTKGFHRRMRLMRVH